MSGNSKRRREARQLKRSNEQLEKNRCWDELNGIYASCAAMLHQHTALANLAHDKSLIAFVQDKQTLVANIRSLAQDLRYLNEELSKLYAQHQGKTKGAKDEAEMMQAFTISEQYNLFMERHNGVVMPTVWHILEVFNQAEIAREAVVQGKVNEARAQDPNDTAPIDVEARPLTTESTQS